MIEEPPLLTIQTNRPRPAQQQLDALAGYPTGFIADAMNGQGAMHHRIRPLAPESLPATLCAPVLTCDNGPADILATLAALSELQPGDVLVSATGGWDQCAAAGDRVLGMLKNTGAAGFVTDGLVRDIEGIREVGLPVFCSGLSPNSPYSKGPGSVGTEVIVGGISVASGDVLVSDENGVVVVPYADVDKVLSRLSVIAKLEAELDEEVRQGLCVPVAISELLASDRVERL